MGAIGRCSWMLMRACWAWALLWGAPAAVVASAADPAHVFSEVFFCQKDSPFSGLAQTLDNDLLFWFSFPGSSWHARLPDFQPELHSRPSVDNISRENKNCDLILDYLTHFSDMYILMPEAKGVPLVELFPLQPLQLGKSNTLVCSVSNIFPPSAELTWEHLGEPVTAGVSTTQIYPVEDLGFQMFSYLELIPREEDIYSCTVRTPRDKFSSMAFWVPRDAIASDLLVNILCGVAFGVGIVLMIIGIVLIVQSRKPRIAD
ncbi:HLA class II histocompatibility antigen, DM alpha chain isoform X2 [Hemicordylus capensis]|uniref:HLA class II histocompatibility antigen, DM alpha chain isoform X2 n=1 Tax=Hemicordylus capensis TaxID=884348 RepID=UPI00230387A5|nr:HLA class II histocompatibility antigen, DM alpha chain isoform X2 [Hemicordylus capensis]